MVFPVKVVTGTSAGSIVGSLYASGMSPDRLELEAEILGKTDFSRFNLVHQWFLSKVKNCRLISTKRSADCKSSSFPLNFAAVATDFETGKAVAFNQGECRTGGSCFRSNSQCVPASHHRQAQICLDGRSVSASTCQFGQAAGGEFCHCRRYFRTSEQKCQSRVLLLSRSDTERNERFRTAKRIGAGKCRHQTAGVGFGVCWRIRSEKTRHPVG